MQDNDSLDEMRKRIQKSLIQTKREQLRDEFGMQFDHMDARLSPEVKNEWLDYLLNFERQFENAPRITVRERVSNPTIQPVAEIPLYFPALLLPDNRKSALHTYACNGRITFSITSSGRGTRTTTSGHNSKGGSAMSVSASLISPRRSRLYSRSSSMVDLCQSPSGLTLVTCLQRLRAN